ncbi:MAG: 3-deoxy-7-phosphoheptulonate synthase [bacterium]
MFVCMKEDIKKDEINKIVKEINSLGFEVKISDNFLDIKCEEKDMGNIIPVLKDRYVGSSIYKHCAHYHNYPSITVNGYSFNEESFAIIAGPCSVESEEQVKIITQSIKNNINFLRGGAYKPRTSPYEFQGLCTEGLELLKKHSNNKPIVTEITSIEQLSYFIDNVDIIQVGARNMQNFDLLKKLGNTNKVILLKRGLSNTIHEWLCAAEYIMDGGNKNVILCERGIRTFENYTRNTLDLSAVIAAKKLTCLPVIVDPAHASGKWWMIEKLSKAALAVGADGLMIEVHHKPCEALSDGPQSLLPDKFNTLIDELKVLAPHFKKKVI